MEALDKFIAIHWFASTGLRLFRRSKTPSIGRSRLPVIHRQRLLSVWLYARNCGPLVALVTLAALRRFCELSRNLGFQWRGAVRLDVSGRLDHGEVEGLFIAAELVDQNRRSSPKIESSPFSNLTRFSSHGGQRGIYLRNKYFRRKFLSGARSNIHLARKPPPSVPSLAMSGTFFVPSLARVALSLCHP